MFTNMRGNITSPGYPNNYTNDLNCTYTISIGSEPRTLELVFTMMDIEDEETCDFDFLTVNGETLCGTDAENITIPDLSGYFQFTFISDDTVNRRGFKISYYIADPCGETMFTNMRGIITSPGYPRNYTHDMNCTYTISIGSEPRTLELVFTMMEIEDDETCDFDFLTVNDETLCGTYAEKITIPDLSGYFQFTFISDDTVNGRGFEISYYIAGPCGETTFTNTYGNITSPGYPRNYPHDMNCTYTISIGSEPMTLELVFTMMDIEDDETCDYDFLIVYNKTLCGTSADSITIPNLSGDFQFTFISDVSDDGKGFVIMYNLTAASSGSCGKTMFAGKSGIITSWRFPRSYPPDMNCTYTIKIDREHTTLKLVFVKMDIEYETNCSYDALTIDGEKLCGTFADNITLFDLSDNFQFTFNSDDVDSGEGFKLWYFLREVSIDECNVTMFTKPSGVISSPGYPNNYPSNISCTYTISIGSEPKLLILMFLHLDMEEETDCGFDALEIGDEIICGTEAENITLPNQSGDFHIYFSSDQDTEGQGFLIRYTFGDPCGDTEFTDPTGIILSPGYPEDYPPYLNCTYTISLDDDNYNKPMNLVLYFLVLEIEEEANCSYDALKIDNLTLCGEKNGSMLTFRRLKDDFIFTFTSDDGVSGKGFEIHYNMTVDPCGRTEFTGYAGIIKSPGYPEDYPNGLQCRYTIKIGKKPMVVKLSFVSVDIEPRSDYCMYDALQIKHRRICGKEAETIFEYESGHFHIDFNSDESKTGKGFQMVYTLTTMDNDIFVRKTDCDINRKCDNFCPTGYSSDRERGYDCPECACLPSFRVVPKCGDKINCPCAYWRDFQGCPLCNCNGNWSRTVMDQVPKGNTQCGMYFGSDMTWVRVASPDFDPMSDYPTYSNCSITIDTGSVTNSSIIQLNFTYLDVEAGEHECIDYIMFSHIYVCGRHERFYTINDVLGNYTIEFHSDANAAGDKGFILDITVINDPCPCRHELWCPCAEGSFKSLMDISMNRLRLAADTIGDVFSYAVAHINRAQDAYKLKGLISDLFGNQPPPKMKAPEPSKTKPPKGSKTKPTKPPKGTTPKPSKTKPTKSAKGTTPKAGKTKPRKGTTPKGTTPKPKKKKKKN